MTYTTSIPGVPGGPITTSFPVKLLIAPAWRTNVRPGIKARSPRLPVQHETANPNTMAVGDATYLFNGSEGRQASWHMTVDDTEAYIGIPLDEVTWQASDGAGPGNYNGISCELAVKTEIVTNDARRAKSQRNAAELMGIIGARLKASPPAKRHHDYAPDQKWCPAQMMNRGEWNRYVDWWSHFNAAEKARMSGHVAAPAPTPASPFNAGDRVRVIADAVNLRLGYGTVYRILNVVKEGDEGTIGRDSDGNYTMQADGYTWLNVKFDNKAPGWIAQGGGASGMWLEKAAVTKPVPKPEHPAYVKVSPVPELLETNMTFADMYNTSAGVTTINEMDFIFVADIVEFKRESPALQYGYSKSAEVKAPYQEGDRVIAAWLVKSNEGTFYYLLTGGEDEWVRVRYEDTVRISDAPLLGNDVH